MALSALLIDLDNTVYAYDPCHDAGLSAAWLAAKNFTPTWGTQDRFRESYELARGIVKRRIGPQAAAHSRLLYFKQMLEDLCCRSRLEDSLLFSDAYWDGFSGVLRPDAECVDVLNKITKTTSIAWVSNYTTRRQIWKLERLGMLRIAKYLITSEEAGAEKPDPRPLRLAAAKLGAQMATAFVIGDSVKDDVEAARACGIGCALLMRESKVGDRTAGLDSTLVVRNWRELGEVIRERIFN